MKQLIAFIAVAFVFAPVTFASALSYAMPVSQPIYFDAISLSGCPYPTSESAFTGTSASTGVPVDVSGSYDTGDSYRVGVPYDTSDSYRVGVSYDTGDSYRVGVSERTSTSYKVGTSFSTGQSDGPVGTSYKVGTSYSTGRSAGPVGSSYATGGSYSTGYSQATGQSVQTGSSVSTNHPKGTTYGRPNYAEFDAPSYANEQPAYVTDYSGYNYVSYYPESNLTAQAGQYAYNPNTNTAHSRHDDVTGVYYPSY